jgi:pimeloyl-ACP methyl ester carboxylesterase
MSDLEPSPVWVFLRGLARESAHWDDSPERFAAQIPNKGVLLADLPGNGRHWQMRTPASIAGMTEFVRREALDAGGLASGPPRRWHLFAISLGAMVALEWLQRHPGEIAGAVLVNTSLRSLSPLYHRLRWQAWPALLSIACQRDAHVRERAILGLTSRHGADRPEWVESRVRAYRQHPIARANLIRQLWAAASFRPSRHSPGTPLLLLNGHGDRLVNPACSQAISRHWGVPLLMHPWAGHDLPLDDPEWVIAEVLHWLQARTAVDASRPAGL